MFSPLAGQAARFGVRENDKIMTINGKTPRNVDDAVAVIKQAGNQIKLVVLREEDVPDISVSSDQEGGGQQQHPSEDPNWVSAATDERDDERGGCCACSQAWVVMKVKGQLVGGLELPRPPLHLCVCAWDPRARRDPNPPCYVSLHPLRTILFCMEHAYLYVVDSPSHLLGEILLESPATWSPPYL